MWCIIMAGKRPKPQKPTLLLSVILKSVLAVLCIIGLVSGLAWIGQRAGKEVAPNTRFAVRTLELDVPTPPGLDKPTFITEVRFLGNLPETVQSVDAATPELLRAAFQKHPWVKEVGAIAVQPDGRVKVELMFRTPALAIRTNVANEWRILDTTGVLLPSNTSIGTLPQYLNPVRGEGIAGQLWPDADARRAAELVVAHSAKQIQKLGPDWIITQPNGRVLRVSVP